MTPLAYLLFLHAALVVIYQERLRLLGSIAVYYRNTEPLTGFYGD
ncbi:hypothetical protein [Yersinia aldovae]|nr:hypothetical protein [Yersinia aldovae]